MAHPWHHAQSSARRFGGVPEDYLAIHDWFDASKAHLGLFTHRALRHHTFGIFEAEERFGPVIRTSAGRMVPTRFIGEQHVREDCGGRVPSVGDWLSRLKPSAWMGRGTLLAETAPDLDDPVAVWRLTVAAGKTTPGLKE